MKSFIFLIIHCVVVSPMCAQMPAAPAEVAQRTASQAAWSPSAGITGTLPPTTQGLGVYLLEESQIFFIQATSQPVYTTNAFYDYTGQPDWSFQQSLAIGAQTVIAERYSILADISSSMTRYNRFDTLDRDTLSFRLVSSAAISERTSVSLSYDSSWYFQRGFSNNGSTFHNITLSASFAQPLPFRGSLLLSPMLTRIWASPTAYEQTIAGLYGAATFPLGEKTVFGLTGRFGSTWYDHYLTSVFPGQRRRDLMLSAGAFIAYTPFKNVSLRLDAMFTHNHSTLNATNLGTGQTVQLYNYNAWAFMPSMGIVVNF